MIQTLALSQTRHTVREECSKELFSPSSKSVWYFKSDSAMRIEALQVVYPCEPLL